MRESVREKFEEAEREDMLRRTGDRGYAEIYRD